MRVPIHAAKANLSKLIEAALAGEDVVISRGSRPVVRLVPVAAPGFVLGPLRGQVPPGGPDFLAPLEEEDLAAWEGR